MAERSWPLPIDFCPDILCVCFVSKRITVSHQRRRGDGERGKREKSLAELIDRRVATLFGGAEVNDLSCHPAGSDRILEIIPRSPIWLDLEGKRPIAVHGLACLTFMQRCD